MSEMNLFNLAMDTYNRLLPELRLKVNPQRQTKWDGYTLGIPTLTQILEQSNPMPGQTVLIGQCQDGLPFLFDLNQPENGSVLITGDKGCGKTHQLQIIVESALRLMAPWQVQVGLITDQVREWNQLLSTPARCKYTHGITSWNDRQSNKMILDLVNLAEDRRNGRRRGAFLLLVIDGLAGVLNWDYDVQVNLHWLLQYGPQSGIWPFVSLDALQAQEMHYWVDVFRTHLLGYIQSVVLANDLAIFHGNCCSQLNARQEFSVFMGSEWLTYDLPKIDPLVER